MDLHIREWDSSYYVSEKRKWICGRFSVLCHGTLFVESSKNPLLSSSVAINFRDIVDVKKTTTTLIFGALTLTTNSGETHWFSSLPDRDGTYHTVCHFWRGALLDTGTSRKTETISETRRTKLGTTLMSIAVDSAKTLQQAATQLSEQGEQIESSLSTMDDLHSDLSIADNVVVGLEAWIGRWRLPQEYKYVQPFIVKDSDIPDVYDYEVLYTKIDSTTFHLQKVGVFRVSKSGVTILNIKQKILQNFSWHNVSKIRVVSPWEMVVIRYHIGEPDLSFAIISSGLVYILEKVEGFAKKKLEYEEVVETRLETECKTGLTSFYAGRQVQTERTSNPQVESSYLERSRLTETEQDRLQAELPVSEEVITDQEVDKLSQTLSNLKSLALAVQQEEDRQNEKLDILHDSVVAADDKLKATTRKTNHLL